MSNNRRKIDIVYTWVNGNDKEWQKKKSKYTNNNEEFVSNTESRFRDNDELRYSIRSVEKYAPWINHIYIITDNQRPDWLDIDNPKITIIDHKDIMPEDALPTYNSLSIEYCMANIPGLSEYFLYANDDQFFGNYVTEDFFFTKDGKPIIRLKKPRNDFNESQYQKTIMNAAKLLQSKNYKFPLFLPSHNIDAYRKSILLDCNKEFKDEINKTIYSRFRNSSNIQRVIYLYYSIATKRGVFKSLNYYDSYNSFFAKKLAKIFKKYNCDCLYFTCKSNNIAKKIKSYNAKLFCINDKLNSDSINRCNTNKFFNNYFPEKCSLEIDNNYTQPLEKEKYDCCILNYWSSQNYGAILTCLGLQCLLNKLGKNAKVINYIGYPKRTKCLNFKKSFSYKFADKYLNLTNKVETYEDFYRLNNECDNFIVGSDQVWRINCAKDFLNKNINWTVFFLDFLRADKKKISYSASLGISDTKDIAARDYEKMNYYLSQFDAISVREDTDAEILKNDFNVPSTQLLDGIFHIPANYIESFTKLYPKRDKYIAYFSLPYFKKNEWHKELLDKISQKLNIPIKQCKYNYETPVEEWLTFIKNADFVISDSYHCILFSILFNIPFIHLKSNTAQSRFDSVFRLFDIKNKTVSKNSLKKQIDFDTLLTPTDWNFVNEKIKKEVEVAEKWMNKALNKEKEIKTAPLPNFLEEQERLTILALYKAKIYKNYYKYKILSNITFGNKKQRYKIKLHKFKILVNQIQRIKENIQPL